MREIDVLMQPSVVGPFDVMHKPSDSCLQCPCHNLAQRRSITKFGVGRSELECQGK